MCRASCATQGTPAAHAAGAPAYGRRVTRRLARSGLGLGLALGATHLPGAARADDDGSDRAVGRVGATLVSDDGGVAVLRNPAGLARRAQRRAQLALSLAGDRVTEARAGRRTARTGQPARPSGLAFAAGATGPLSIGAVFATDDDERALPTPGPLIPPEQIARDFDHRYAGLAARTQRSTIAVAVAARVTDWLALGVTGSVAALAFEERRRLWAGFSGRDDLGSPTRDLDVTLRGDDGAVPGAVFGALLAPASLPLELAASIGFANAATMVGTATLAADPAEMTLDAEAATATVTLPSETTARLGARWLGARWSVEVAGSWHRVRRAGASPTWSIDRARVVDRVGVATELAWVPSRAARSSHGALAVAGELALLPGLLWLTAGAAYVGSATPTGAMTATLGSPDRLTLGAGVEANVSDVTIALGASHGWLRATTQDRSTLGYDDPFASAAGDVGVATIDGSVDTIGVSVEVAM